MGFETTGRDHPNRKQARCECGCFLPVDADDITEAFGSIWYEWKCKGCGQLHCRGTEGGQWQINT